MKFTDQWLNKYPKVTFSFILSFWLFLLLPLGLWTSNEENYLGVAWRSFQPHEFTGLQESVSYRFLYEWLFGFSIKYLLGFEFTHALGRLLIIVLFAIALTYFLRTLKFSIIEASVILLLFLKLGQTILGGESIFWGVEPKSFGYIFVFISAADLLNKRWFRGYAFLALATYFHFLIGGFWFLVFTLFAFTQTPHKKQLARKVLFYLGLCFPLFILIALSQTQSTFDPYQTTVSTDWIYSIYRNPHHVAPFSNSENFRVWYEGMIFLIGLTVTSGILTYSSSPQEKPYAKLILALHLYLCFALIISYFDKGGVLGKFYLFRPSSMTLFLLLCFFSLYLKLRIIRNLRSINLALLSLLVALLMPIFPTHNFIYDRLEPVVLGQKPFSSLIYIAKDLFYTYEDIHTYYHFGGKFQNIARKSQPDDIFLVDPRLEAETRYLSFERRFNRPTLVTRKFVPTSPDNLQRWYRLVHLKQDLFERGCPATIVKQYPVRYLVTHIENRRVDNCGKVVYERGMKLIEVDPIFRENS